MVETTPGVESGPSPTGGRRGSLALGLGLALLVVLIPAALVLGPAVRSDRSTLDRGAEGSAALAGVLRGLDFEVESLRVGLVPLSRKPAGSVLIMPSAPGIIPSSVVGQGELEILEEWVQKGSTLVVVTHYPSAVLDLWDISFEWDALERLPRGVAWRGALPVLPHSITLGDPLAVSGRGGFEATMSASTLYAVDRTPIVVSHPVGKGTVIAVADPAVLSNQGISREGNLDFWVRLLRHHLGDDGVVMFDDLHAGAMDGKGVIAYARRAGLLPAILLALFVAGLYAWRAGARFGSVLPPVTARNPRASSELVHAVAGLYERASLPGHALAVLSRQFRRQMERRSGLPWDQALLAPWVERELGTDAARSFARIRRGFAALLADPRPDRDSTLELAKLVARFEHEFLAKKRR